jgi:hypothetical protein
MSNLRAAAQQALKALEYLNVTAEHRVDDRIPDAAIVALRAALAQENGRPCSCRWVNDTLTQECTLHRIIKEQAHDWCERAKAAEAKLAALESSLSAEVQPEPANETEATDEDPAYHPSIWSITTPPRREWQGLTDEEISDIFEAEPRYHYPPICATDREFARAIEAALKERNHG